MLREYGERQADGQRFAAAAERNKDPILDVLRRVLPTRGTVLEVASGTGQHVVHFAKALRSLRWQPSEPDPEFRNAVALRVAEENLPNVEPPVDLDVLRRPWPVQTASAVVCINLVHIAPWSATLALFDVGKDLLPAKHILFLYGPYRRFGRHNSKGNEQFDAELRARNSDWGLRDLEAVSETAASSGFALTEVVEMPANNFSLVFTRT
jgi:hypothetical protein